MRIRYLLSFVLFAAVAVGGLVIAASPVGAGDDPVASTLREVQSPSGIPADLELVYDDMHALHGGVTIEIAEGKGKITERKRGGQDPEVTTGEVTAKELMSLVKLLVELEAWEQRTEERTLVPDESLARLEIQVGGHEAGFWEFYNDMGENNRLSRIRDRMKSVVTP